MSRLLALAIVATLLAGCKSYPKVDPIFGRQVIPSQRTGSLGALVSKDGTTPPPQYYDQGNSGGALPPAPAGTDPLSPAGGFDFRGSSSRTVTPESGASSGWSRPGTSSDSGGSAVPGIPARATGPDDPTRRPIGENADYGRSRYDINNSTPGSSAPPPAPSSGSAPFAPTRTDSLPAAPRSSDTWRSDGPYRSTGWSGETRDIMELPARGSLHGAAADSSGGSARTSEGAVRSAGYATLPSREPTAAADAIRPSAESSDAEEVGPYGYDPAYRWLKGRLEYSPTIRRWKLRYIPITGRTDQYGGSVMLEDSPALADVRPGDAAMIQGQIVGDSEPGGFAPLYRADRVSKLP